MNEYCTLFLPEALTIISKLPFSNPTALFSEKKDEQEYRYTHLEFALEWAPGVCYNSTDCTDTIPDTWTMYGLWPSVDYTTLNYTSVNYTSVNYTSVNYTSVNYTSLDNTSVNYTSVNYTSVNYTSLNNTSVN